MKKVKQYNNLILSISWLLSEARNKVIRQVNSILTQTYWYIWKQIVEYELWKNMKKNYWNQLLKKIAQDLKSEFGRGFSWRNLYYMKLFYSTYWKLQTLSAKFEKLTWSHFVELLSITNNNERSFYEIECIENNRSVRELSRQINSALYERLALSNNKSWVKQLAKKWQILQ